jgi:DNA repair protein RadA/Sms
MKVKTIFKCSNCGRQESKWIGKCPSCHEWDTLKEEIVDTSKGLIKDKNKKKVEASKLLNVEGSNSDRIVTSINEFNRVMGGGIVKDSLTIITSQPGGGKSTLVLAIANEISAQGYKVLYASGEESESQIKNRADRILNKIHENLWILADTSMDNVLENIKEIDADLIVIDSIQTFTLEAFPGSRSGSPTQTMECANELQAVAKGSNRPRAIIMVGQMTKDDELAGLRALEHLVDAVLFIESENNEELRSLVSTKNRFGSTGEMGFFAMLEQGMVSIDNPSAFFMTNRDKGDLVSGSALTVVKEGTRPIIVEIESLVSKTFTPFPSRIGECMKREQLITLISILEQKGGLSLYDKDIVLKTTGGLKFK